MTTLTKFWGIEYYNTYTHVTERCYYVTAEREYAELAARLRIPYNCVINAVLDLMTLPADEMSTYYERNLLDYAKTK